MWLCLNIPAPYVLNSIVFYITYTGEEPIMSNQIYSRSMWLLWNLRFPQRPKSQLYSTVKWLLKLDSKFGNGITRLHQVVDTSGVIVQLARTLAQGIQHEIARSCSQIAQWRCPWRCHLCPVQLDRSALEVLNSEVYFWIVEAGDGMPLHIPV